MRVRGTVQYQLWRRTHTRSNKIFQKYYLGTRLDSLSRSNLHFAFQISSCIIFQQILFIKAIISNLLFRFSDLSTMASFFSTIDDQKRGCVILNRTTLHRYSRKLRSCGQNRGCPVFWASSANFSAQFTVRNFHTTMPFILA